MTKREQEWEEDYISWWLDASRISRTGLALMFARVLIEELHAEEKANEHRRAR